MKLNKTLLSIGTLAAVVTPIATVVSCGDKTPAKEQPPVSPTNAGGQKPGSQTPGLQVPGPTDTHTDQRPTDPSQSRTQAAELDEGIINYMPDGKFTIDNLNSIFGQFSTSISPPANLMAALTGAGRAKVDTSRKVIKVMIVAKPISNHGDVVYLAGTIGFGEGGNAVYFTYWDFDKSSAITDKPTRTTTEKQINIFNPDPAMKILLFAFMPGIDKDEAIAKLQKLATDNGITNK